MERMREKKFKTSKEGIEFFEDFTYWKAPRMSDLYYNKLDKLRELEGKYKGCNEILRDMFGDWEMVIYEIENDLSCLRNRYDLQSEKNKVDYLNEMLERYGWYIEQI